MNALWLYRLNALRRHLSMLLVMLCAIVLQSQLAVAGHRCPIDLSGASVQIQHLDHGQTGSKMMKSALCDKHCVPDGGQQKVEHPPLVALPLSMTLAVINIPCGSRSAVDGSLKPPAAGPPATIRFCRFRE
ncbi:DUF2946 domain-containing protein [Pluralibacter gergoviae]|uniref:DUF2946 domain-containing protein n=1 Tax=Pluralibacter gergoviae TaxID=61647 RepID=UPI003EE20691